MTGYMRLWNPEWTNVTNLRKRGVHGDYRMTVEIKYSGTASAAATEVGAAANNALNGTTTPVIVYVASTSANDNSGAAGHCQSICIIGISVASAQAFINGTESPVYSVEEVTMDATDGTTDVTSSRYYLRVFHAYCQSFGTGGSNADGNITVADDAVPTTTYLTITAAQVESNNGGLIYVYDGYYGRWNHLFAGLNDAAFNNA